VLSPTLFIKENSVEIIQDNANELAIAGAKSFLSRRLHISRKKFWSIW